MKYFVSLLIINLFLIHSMQAQQNKNASIVYLNDGSVYVGEIIKEDIFEIVMKTKALDTITLNKAFIKRTARGKKIIAVGDGKFHKNKAFLAGVEFTLHANAESSYSQLSSYFGKRIGSKFILGAGVGLTVATANDVPGLWTENEFFQAFSYGRYYFNHKKIRLFSDMKLGWGFALDDAWRGNMSEGGFYAAPGIGIEFANRKKIKWSIKLSQNIQQSSTQEQWGNDDLPIQINIDQLYNRTALSVGINF